MNKWIRGASLGLVLCASTAGAQTSADANSERLLQRYVAAVSEAVEQHWVRPDSVTLAQVCPVEVRMLPSGYVVEATARDDCEFDAVGRRSVEAAVRKAAPLPYAGYESVFRRVVVLRFRARDEIAAPEAAAAPRGRRRQCGPGRTETLTTCIGASPTAAAGTT